MFSTKQKVFKLRISKVIEEPSMIVITDTKVINLSSVCLALWQ